MGSSWVALYIGGDLGFYFLVKILRGDFWYYLPLGGKTEIVSSILTRVGTKIITDFTSLVQYRHPNELGGLNWILGFVLTMVSLPIAIVFAGSSFSEKTISLAWTVVKYFIPSSLVCFAVFFLNIERKYWHTFWSTQRGKDLSMAYLLKGKTDKVKFEVMTTSRHHWNSIEDKVRKWVGENWERWEEDKPEWFTDQMKALVPVEFIPATGDARRIESVRRASVDADAEEGLGKALRASIRRASIGGVNDRSVRVAPIEEDN